MTTRHFLNDLDLSREEQNSVIARAIEMKQNPDDFRNLLSGKILGMIFQKSSTRTRVSFQAGIAQLGGQGIFLSGNDIQLGRGEPLSDTGAVLSRYLDIIMIRTFKHADVQTIAKHSTVPVINGLDDLLHPCQSLADLMVIQEHKGQIKGLTMAYVGDGNNVANSLMLAGGLAGMSVRIVCPKGFEPKEDMVQLARDHAQDGAKIEVTNALEGVDGVDVVYTDVWASMGQEAEAAERLKVFEGFQVNDAMMDRADKESIFLHCLPAHRGEEVSAGVIDGPKSVVFDQAENRMHAQKALMAFLAA